jgi:CPA1 family monovalent cation:H+ antiporter
LKLWQIAVVTLAGVAFGWVQPGKLTYAFGQITLYVLLPGLIFEGAWNLDYRAMVRQWKAIFVLAIPGVLLTAVIIAGALSVVRVPFDIALLQGAILSATDPIAVVAAFKRLRVPKLLATIVESESLLNDAVAVVLYRAVLIAVLAGGGGATYLFVTLTSLAGSAFGILLGVFFALIVAILLRRTTTAAPQIVATLAGAYGVYFLVDQVHGSGIFATIAFGIALRFFERRSLALHIVADVDNFWGLAAGVGNVVVFFLVGAALDASIVTRAPIFVIATLAGVAVARFGVSALLAPGGYPREWLDVIRVSGMRGALSLALAISLPVQTPEREAIIAATFAVAIATIVSSALTVPGVVARVGLKTAEEK